MRAFAPEEFLQRLADDRLHPEIAVEGMLKVDPDNPGAILLDAGGSCDDWVPIPREMVETIAYSHQVGCQDHRHPYVRVVLKEPAEDDAAAQLFLRLYQSARSSAAPAQVADATLPLPPPDGARFALGAGASLADFDDGVTLLPGRPPIGGDPICPPFRGPCLRQPDGSYKRVVRTWETDCERVLVPCTPTPPPIRKQIDVTYSGWGVCTSFGGGNPRDQLGTYFQVSGSGFVPGAICSIRATSGGGAQQGIASTRADAQGRINVPCFRVSYPGPGQILTFVATDQSDNGTGTATHYP